MRFIDKFVLLDRLSDSASKQVCEIESETELAHHVNCQVPGCQIARHVVCERPASSHVRMHPKNGAFLGGSPQVQSRSSLGSKFPSHDSPHAPRRGAVIQVNPLLPFPFFSFLQVCMQ